MAAKSLVLTAAAMVETAQSRYCSSFEKGGESLRRAARCETVSWRNTAWVSQATVDHQPVHPGAESGIAPELRHGGKQLEECILRDIHGLRFIAAEAQGDRVNLILVGLKQGAKGVPLPAAAPFDQIAIRPLQHNPGHETIITRIFFPENGVGQTGRNAAPVGPSASTFCLAHSPRTPAVRPSCPGATMRADPVWKV